MSSFPSISSPIPIPQGTPTEDEARTASTHRATKRKLDDAFSRLDSAIGQEDERPPPPKRTNTSSSFLSTLSRYGIMSKSKSTPSSSSAMLRRTPHLSKILSRAKSTFKPSPTTSAAPHAAYRPSSVTSFLERLATFKIATYSGKPKCLEASAAAAAGWINDGKDRLVCGICNASWVVAGREGLSRDAANALVEKQRASLVDAHKEGCPWRKQQCDASIYRIPLQSPQTMVRAIKSNAVALNTPFANVHVKHPLSATQLNSLKQTIANFTLPDATEPTPQPCDAAVLASLFGWSVPATSERPTSLSRPSSFTRKTPSLSRGATPSASRAATPAPMASISRPGTPTNAGRRFAFLPLASSSLSIALGTGQGAASSGDIVHCALCQRRVGLWAFRAAEDSSNGNANGSSHATEDPSSPPPNEELVRKPPPRQFDLLKEHRAFCPYVVQSTVVPSMHITQPAANGLTRSATNASTSAFEHGRKSSIEQHRKTGSTSSLADPNAPVEGWRAVLTIVLRYGASRRQRERIEEGVELMATRLGEGGSRLTEGGSRSAEGGSRTGEGETRPDEDAMSEDSAGVESMVEDVKKRGGRELLKYVKGLIG
ncbi:zf-C3HC-domain-containing protein [Schizophyllum commune Tattone D]|nr:zf-C3HC-domain-containing protein [Schizophyllum commune Tattone D]